MTLLKHPELFVHKKLILFSKHKLTKQFEFQSIKKRDRFEYSHKTHAINQKQTQIKITISRKYFIPEITFNYRFQSNNCFQFLQSLLNIIERISISCSS